MRWGPRSWGAVRRGSRAASAATAATAVLAVIAAAALAATGALSPQGCIADPAHNPDSCAKTAAGLDNTVGVTVSADGKSVYATGYADNAVVAFKRNKAGALSPAGCIADPTHNPDSCAPTAAGLDNAFEVTVSADGKSVYATGNADNAIVAFKRNKTTGGLTPAGCVADLSANPDACRKTTRGLTGAAGVAVSPDGKSVYATGNADNAVVSFKRNKTTGKLTPAGCIADRAVNPGQCGKTTRGLVGADGVAVSADGKSVYVTGFYDHALVIFKRNTTTGALTPAGCIGDSGNNPDGCTKTAAGLDSAGRVAVSADGKSVYVSSGDDNAIAMFKRNKNTGSLTSAGCIADPVNNPDSCTKTAAGLDNAIGVAVTADNKSVYATGHDDNSVVSFKRNTTTGKLTPVVCFADPANNPDSCPNTASGLDGAEDVAVSADGKSVVAAGLLDNAIVAFKRTP